MPAREHSRLPHVGDEVLLSCDALVEVASANPGMPPTWRYLAAGSRGKLLGWRERPNEQRAVVDVAGEDRRLVVFIRQAAVSPAQQS